MIKKYMAVLFGLALISQVHLPSVNAAKKDKPDLEFDAKYNRSLSSEYFGFIGFNLKNNTNKWQHITAVEIVFPNAAHNDIVKIVAGKQLKAWNEAVSHQKAVKDFWWGTALGGIAAATSDGKQKRRPASILAESN